MRYAIMALLALAAVGSGAAPQARFDAAIVDRNGINRVEITCQNREEMRWSGRGGREGFVMTLSCVGGTYRVVRYDEAGRVVQEVSR